MKNKATIYPTVLNVVLLASGILCAGSGLLLQLHYHVGGGSRLPPGDIFWGQSYSFWSLFHIINSILLLAAVLLHTKRHLKIYKNLLAKRRFGNHRELLLFTFTFATAAILGMAAWTMSAFSHFIRHSFIEVHDKVSLLLIVFLVLHIWRRKRLILKTKL